MNWAKDKPRPSFNPIRKRRMLSLSARFRSPHTSNSITFVHAPLSSHLPILTSFSSTMASRGGGGRRSDQYASGGRGRGEGRGRGRGRDTVSHPESTTSVGRGATAPVPSVVAPSRPTTQPSDYSAVRLLSPALLSCPIIFFRDSSSSSMEERPVVQRSVAVVQPSSSSATVSKLSEDVKQQLTIPSVVPPVSSKALMVAQRPGSGTFGKSCSVRANHFLLEVVDKDLHHYDVTITPEVPKSINRNIIKELVDMYSKTNLNGKKLAYDGMKSIYTAGALPFETKEFPVELQEEGEKSANRPKRKFEVKIKFAAKVSIYHLEQFLQRRQRDAPQETVHALNVVLRQLPSNMFTVVGRSFFSRSLGKATIPGDGFEYWKGYYQSICLTQMGLSLNLDVSARVFYEPICVTDFIAKYCVTDVTKPLSDQDRIKVKNALKGIRVEVTHSDSVRPRSYKITGISNQMSNQLMFDDSGTQVSVAQYFSQKYKLELNYPWLPCIEAGKRRSLPMEVCKIVEEQRFSNQLNKKQVTNLLRATCQRPHDREENIKKVVVPKHFHAESFDINDFGMRISDQFTTIEARVLTPPMLQYYGDSVCKPQLGRWNMTGKKMINGGTVKSWTCVNFSSLTEDVVQSFYKELINMCRNKGMVFSERPVIPFSSASPIQIEGTLEKIHKQCSSTKNKPLQLLIVILPDITGSYGTIKRVCETELGIVSQCCQPRNAKNWPPYYLENVSLKMNVKVGGRNTVLVDAPYGINIPRVTDDPTIIFGADVTHPAPGEDTSPSIAAVVASMDWPEVTKYRGLISSQSHREEIIQDLYKLVEDPVKGDTHTGMIRDHLLAFYQSTKLKPNRIIFYRDGVSEGQFSQVLLYEMDAIRKACASIKHDYMPRVTFVVVQKRHHTRFFPVDHENRRMTDRSGNVLPGTVVDQKICHPMEFDFYLNSHAGIQGTSRPTHYHVLFDENKFNADQLQSLTNNLCYTFARCTKSVSIVPPVYYAHLLAFRARYYVEGNEWPDSRSGVGRSTIGAQREVKPLPAILDNVKAVMFYC